MATKGHCIPALQAALRFVKCVVHGHEQAATNCLLAASCSPEEMLGELQSQSLVGFVFSPNGNSLLPASWNAPFALQLQAQYFVQNAFTDELRKSLQEALTTLGRSGIECLMLKGPVFGQRYFDTPYRRRVRDLDILVHERALERCIESLETIGYVTCEPRPYALSARKRRLDHATTVHRGRQTIDVHWRLRNAAVYRIDYEEIWRSAETICWDGQTYRVLGPEREIIFHLLMIAHDVERGACRVKHLADAYCLIRRHYHQIEWSDFFCCAQREGTLSIGLNVLDLLLRLFDCRDEFPQMDAFLAKAADQIACSNDEFGLRLLAGARGNTFNRRWFARIYPTWDSRAVIQFLDRNVLAPRRIPWLFLKGIRGLLRA